MDCHVLKLFTIIELFCNQVVRLQMIASLCRKMTFVALRKIGNHYD